MTRVLFIYFHKIPFFLAIFILLPTEKSLLPPDHLRYSMGPLTSRNLSGTFCLLGTLPINH